MKIWKSPWGHYYDLCHIQSVGNVTIDTNWRKASFPIYFAFRNKPIRVDFNGTNLNVPNETRDGVYDKDFEMENLSLQVEEMRAELITAWRKLEIR